MTAQNGQKTAAQLLLKVEAKLTDLDAASFTYSGLTASEIRAAPTTMTTETEKGHHPSNKEPFIHDLLPTPLNFRRGSNQRMYNGMDTAIHSLKACLF